MRPIHVGNMYLIDWQLEMHDLYDLHNQLHHQFVRLTCHIKSSGENEIITENQTH